MLTDNEHGSPKHGLDSFERRRNMADTGVILALTPDEFQLLRRMLMSQDRLEKMIVAHERAEWFWSSLGVWIKWIAAIGAGLVAAKLLLSDTKEILRGWLTLR